MKLEDITFEEFIEARTILYGAYSVDITYNGLFLKKDINVLLAVIFLKKELNVF